MAWYGSHGQQTYYEDTGRGDPVVLLPGWGGSITELNHLRRELVHGFRVIAADLPGSGRSQPQPRQYQASYYTDDARTLLGLLDALEVEAAHLVGFSDGGEDALLMAALRPHAIPRGEYLEAPNAGHDVHQSSPRWLASAVVGWLSAH